MSGVWEWDTERFPEPEEMIKELNKKNIHLSLWNYPYLQEDSPAFKELAERGFFIKNKEGHPAMFKATADSEFLCDLLYHWKNLLPMLPESYENPHTHCVPKALAIPHVRRKFLGL